MKKKINVVAAIIKNQNKYLIAQRPKTGFFKNKWEFPGAKIEKAGNEVSLLLDDIKKNFNFDIALNKQIVTTNYKHPFASINITFIECELLSSVEKMELKTHQKALWVSAGEFDNYDWVEPDLKVIEIIKNTK
ncbi:NUDIX domain-containing protein [Mycoplasma todarodis]|uniref:Adenine DNA glycosylase C-terminal domain-containing protein n=1 Tax=Mycoplasma todarodis TaxID=1937191 RepID=A0A4R0XJ73_9MOLU|nr:NUDIX domain-containing protein [Mycoplasma todarodis]TCG10663.1 hypothetical protein C4B25_03330 [Mycoplasma todarodis]